MHKNPNYTIQQIADTIQLLPFGQAIADFNPTVEIADPQAWEDFSYEEPDIAVLKLHGIIEEDTLERIETVGEANDLLETLKIGGIYVEYHGAKDYFPREFYSFRMSAMEGVPKAATKMRVNVLTTKPGNAVNGNVILRNKELIVIDAEDIYVLIFPPYHCVTEIWLTKDATNATIWLDPANTIHYGLPTVREEIFHGLRHCYLNLAAQHEMYAIHSASILYRDHAWLFSGHSGMGKSTHAALWQTQYDVSMLNGDLNLLAFDEDGAPVIHGLPWCGTSGINTTKTHPLKGITMLVRGQDDHIEELSEAKRVTSVLHRLISPMYTEEMLKNALAFSRRMCDNITVVRLACTKEPSAAEVMKAYVDERL